MAAVLETVKKTDVQEVDQILHTAKIVEGLSEQNALDRVPALLGNVDQTYFELGGVLSVIQSNKWYANHGAETFRDFIENTYALEYRKAMYLISIYNSLVDASIPWSAVSGLGWTKLKELASVLTKENVSEWVTKAEGLTVIQLREAVKASKATANLKAGETPPEVKSNLSTFTLKVFEDQKASIKLAISKARKELSTESDAVAIEAICNNYLGGGNVNAPKKMTLAEFVQHEKISPETMLMTFGELFPNIDVNAKFPE